MNLCGSSRWCLTFNDKVALRSVHRVGHLVHSERERNHLRAQRSCNELKIKPFELNKITCCYNQNKVKGQVSMNVLGRILSAQSELLFTILIPITDQKSSSQSSKRKMFRPDGLFCARRASVSPERRQHRRSRHIILRLLLARPESQSPAHRRRAAQKHPAALFSRPVLCLYHFLEWQWSPPGVAGKLRCLKCMLGSDGPPEDRKEAICAGTPLSLCGV